MPSTGLLSFFYAEDDTGESMWSDPDYVRVFRFDDLTSLQSVEPPAAVGAGSTCVVSFQLGADVPPWPWDPAAATQWPIRDDEDMSYLELRESLHPTGRYLMGFPIDSSLAYDPTPSPEWRSLLTMRSDEDLKCCWNDDGWLMTFIEDRLLRAGDFSHINADAG